MKVVVDTNCLLASFSKLNFVKKSLLTKQCDKHGVVSLVNLSYPPLYATDSKVHKILSCQSVGSGNRIISLPNTIAYLRQTVDGYHQRVCAAADRPRSTYSLVSRLLGPNNGGNQRASRFLFLRFPCSNYWNPSR